MSLFHLPHRVLRSLLAHPPQASFRPNASAATGPPVVTNTTRWERLPPPPAGGIGTLDFQVCCPPIRACCMLLCTAVIPCLDIRALPLLNTAFLYRTPLPSHRHCHVALPPPSPSPNTQATGTGEATVSALLRFVPSVLPAFPAYRGIFVEAAIQLVDPLTGGPTGRRISAVPLARLVAYTVQLTTPDDLGAVTVQVYMPGGLEPLDPNLASGADLGPTCGAELVGSTSTWTAWNPSWWWPVCPGQVRTGFMGPHRNWTSITVSCPVRTSIRCGCTSLPPVSNFGCCGPWWW